MRSSDPDLTTITRYLTRPEAAIPGPFGVSAAFTVGRSQRPPCGWLNHQHSPKKLCKIRTPVASEDTGTRSSTPWNMAAKS